MQPVSLPRTAQPSLEFTGDIICDVKSPSYQRHIRSPKAYCHWFEVTIYKTKIGRYVVAVRYRWSGKLSREVAQDFAWACAGEDDVLSSMEKFDPTTCVTGYPEGNANWDRKQEMLLNNIETDWDLLVLDVKTKIASLQTPEHVE